MDMEICASFSSDAGNEETHKCTFPLLTYLRCKKLHEDYKRRKDEGIKSFIIANNIKDVGTINEMVVRMECIKKQDATPKLIFMKCENNINDENQIKNFFESFNKIKDIFKQNNEPQNDHQETGSSRLTDHDESEIILQEMFNCKFTDCEFFIVSKNLSSDFFCLRETKEKHDDAVQYLFGNAKGTEQKYQLQMETCHRIIKDNSETEIENLKLRIDEFCEKVTFLSIEEGELSSKNLIDEALLKCIGKFRRHKCMISKTLFEEIKYILNSYEVCTFLTETTSLISDTINYIDLTMSLFTHLDTYDLHNFSLKALQSLYEVIISLPNKHTIIITQFPRYEKIKILNLFINLSKTNLCIFINNGEDNIKWKSARKTYSYKHKIRVYVYIEEGLQLPEDKGANEIFVRVEHANETNISIQEKLSMDEVNIPANMKMIFQGYEIQANTLCRNWREFLDEDSVCDILETNKLTVGCRLPYLQDSNENLQFQINIPSEEKNIELLESNPKLKIVNEDYLLNNLSNKVNAILTGNVETINYKSLLAFTIKCKKKFISNFVYFIELRQFNEILEANENFNDASEFLVSKILKLRGIEEKLLLNACIYTGKVMIFFYGFDKLSACAGNTCIKLVMTLKETKIWKMFISGKQNIAIHLESDLQQNSIQFIKNIFPENFKCLLDTWKQKVNLPQDETNYQQVKDCASKIISSLKLEEILLKEILVIPLQMKLFEDSYCGKMRYKAFNFDLIKLLEIFINSKVFHSYSEIPKNKFNEYQESRRNKFIREQLRGSCQLIASIIVPVLLRNQTQNSCDLFCAMCKDLGLISYTQPHSPLSVNVNITIAEYLAAEFISKYSLFPKKYSRMEVCPLPWEKYDKLKKSMEAHADIEKVLQYSDIICKKENEFPKIESETIPIHQAVTEGNINILKIICQSEKSLINSQNNFCETPLHIACFMGETKAATFLLENDCSVDMRDKNGDTAIHIAALQDQSEITEMLLRHKGKESLINLPNSLGKTALHIACLHGNLNVFDVLLKEENIAVNSLDNDENSVLHYAAERDQTQIIERLLKHDEQLVNIQNKSGKTALHIASRQGYTCAVKLLLRYDCSAVCRDQHGDTAFHVATREDKNEIMEILNDHDNSLINAPNAAACTPLHIATFYNNIDALNFLLDKGCQLDCLDANGDTAFHIAAQEGYTYIMETLFPLDESLLNLPSAFGYTALHYASFHGNIGIVKFLLDEDCLIELLDRNGNTAFHFAAFKNEIEIMEHILENVESIIDLQNKFGNTPLHIASFLGNTGAVLLLLRYSCKLSQQNNEGDTAFHFAARNIKTDVLELLLSYDESLINLQNKVGNTPLNIAACNGNTNSVVLLLKHFCMVSLQNEEGDTAFHFAARNKEADFMEALLSYDVTVINHQNNEGNTPLHIAVRCENTKAVTLLLRNNCIVTKRNEDGDTAFHFLTSKNEVDIMIRLLEHNSSLIDMQNYNGDTPLHLACREGKTEAANFLLSKKCNINIRDRYGETAFYYALKNGQEYIIELMMQHHKSLISDKHKFEELMRISNMENDASVLDHNGKYEEALRIYTNVIEARTKILGASHPDTVSCMKRKAQIFEELGHYAESLRMYNQVAETKSVIFDDAHYETHTSNSKMGNPKLERKQKSTEPQPSTSATSDGPYIEKSIPRYPIGGSGADSTHGYEFHLAIAMLLLLTLKEMNQSDPGFQYQMWLNKEGYGIFDDIVVRYKKSSGNWVKICVQCKHRQERINLDLTKYVNCITELDFLSNRNRSFSLEKYVYSFREIKDVVEEGNTYYILLSNAAYNKDKDLRYPSFQCKELDDTSLNEVTDIFGNNGFKINYNDELYQIISKPINSYSRRDKNLDKLSLAEFCNKFFYICENRDLEIEFEEKLAKVCKDNNENLKNLKARLYYLVSQMYQHKIDLIDTDSNIEFSDRSIFYNIPHACPNFTGRVKEIQNIKEALESEKGRHIFDLLVTGMAGMGKTEIVREYIDKNKQRYKHVVWINAEHKDSLDNSFRGLAISCNIVNKDCNDDISTVVKAIYSHFKEHTLFVFDNTNKVILSKNEKNEYIYITNKTETKSCRFIVISQDQKLTTNNSLIVDQFSKEDALHYLSLSFECSIEEKLQLAQTVQYWPLALCLAVSLIELQTENSLGRKKCSDAIKTLQFDMIGNHLPGIHEMESHCGSLQSLWRQIQDKIQIIDNLSLQIIYLLSFSDANDFPLELLKFDSFSDGQMINSVQLLRNNSLVRITDGKMSIHRILHSLVRNSVMSEIGVYENILLKGTKMFQKYLDLQNQYDWLKTSGNIHMVTFLRHICESHIDPQKYIKMANDVLRKLIVSQDLKMHCGHNGIFDTITTIAKEKLGESNEDTLCTLSKKALMLQNIGKYKDSLTLFNYCVSKYDENDIKRLPSMDEKVLVLEKMGKYEEAIGIYDYLIETQTKISGKYSSESLKSINNKALLLNKMGRYEEALCMYNSVIKAHTDMLGEYHSDILICMQNKALVLCSQCKYEEALIIVDLVIENGAKVMGQKHLDVLSCMDLKALVLNKLEKNKEALSIYNHVIEKMREIFGENHPKTLESMHSKGLALNEVEKCEEALNIHDHVIEKRTEYLGEYHPETLTSLHSKASVLENMETFGEALCIYNDVIEKRTAIFDETNLETLACMLSKASVLRKMRMFEEALLIYEHVIVKEKEILGENNPLVLASMNTSASVICDLGRHDEALIIYNHVIKIRTEVLGANHLEILTSLHNKALVLSKMENYDEALIIVNEVIERKANVFGKNHLKTVKSMQIKASVLDSMEKCEESLNIYNKIIDIRTEKLGKNHRQTVYAVRQKAFILYKIGDYAKSLIILNDLVKSLKETYGENHPYTEDIINIAKIVSLKNS